MVSFPFGLLGEQVLEDAFAKPFHARVGSHYPG
jgi:hypothetical protein